MYIVFLNPQGNFDKHDSFWTEHPDFGGQLVYVKEIAIALSRLGHKVDIITRRFNDPKLNVFNEPFDSYEQTTNVRIVRIACGGENFLAKEALWEHLDEWTDHIIEFFTEQGVIPDFITGHYGDGGLSAAMIKQKAGIPYSFTGHSLGAQKLEKLGADLKTIKDLDEKYRFSIRIEAERTAIKYANIIFVSTLQEQLEQYSHILYKDVTIGEQDKFVIAPPGANTEVFNHQFSDDDLDFTDKFNQICQRDIDQDRIDLPYIILASRLDPKKNHVGLIKAYAQNKELQKRANIAISLRGIENAFEDYSKSKPDEIKILDEIMTLIREHHLIGHVTFISINSQKELAAFYRFMVAKHSIFCLTALYEPFGLAPIEAMSSGLPAVVTKNGGPSEVLQENGIDYGVLVDPFNTEDIANGLIEVLDHYEHYQMLGIQRVNDKYTWNATAKNYEQAIIRSLKTYDDSTDVDINPYFYSSLGHSISLDLIINKLFRNGVL